MHVVKLLFSRLRLLDNYTSRSGWGLGSELVYYVVHLLATTVCFCLYLVNCPYDFHKYTYSAICYDITQLFVCYMWYG